MEVLGGMYLVAVLFLFILAVLWFLMPFAVFGTKDKLNQLIDEAKASNRVLQELTKEVVALERLLTKQLEVTLLAQEQRDKVALEPKIGR